MAAAVGRIALKNIAGDAVGGTGSPDAPQMLTEAADAVNTIMNVAREQAAKIKEQQRQDDNEFNIRKNFLENAIAAINDLLQGQYNIMVLTDQEHDIEWGGPLKGRLLPMDLLEVDIGNGKTVNFQVIVFDSGKYLRKGKWEEDSISWYPDSAKMWKDVNMHLEFSDQPKKPTDGVPNKEDLQKQAADKKTADDAAAAKKTADDAATAKKAQDDAAAKQPADVDAAKQGGDSAGVKKSIGVGPVKKDDAASDKDSGYGEGKDDDEKDGKANDTYGDAKDGTQYGKGSAGTIKNVASHIGKNGASNEENDEAEAQGGKPDVKGKKNDIHAPKKHDEDEESGEEEDDEGKSL